MEPNEVVKFMVICSVVVLPALAITARFALKPIVDAILRLKEGGVISTDNAGTLREVVIELQQLRAEVSDLATRDIEHRARRLRDVESFHAALREAPRTEALPVPK